MYFHQGFLWLILYSSLSSSHALPQGRGHDYMQRTEVSGQKGFPRPPPTPPPQGKFIVKNILLFNIIQGMRRVIHDLDLLQSLQQLQHLLVAVDIWLLLWHLLHLARDQPRGINHLPVLLLQQQQQLLLPQQLQQHHLLVHVLQQQQLRPRVQDIWLLH